MTRGVLIDIAGLKGVDILPITYEITVADLEQALQKQGLSLPAGVLIYTGWSKHWGVDNKLYMSGCPGIGVAAAEWLIKQDPMLLGSTTGRLRSLPIRINRSVCRSTTSHSPSMAFICSRTSCWRTSPRHVPTSLRSLCSRLSHGGASCPSGQDAGPMNLAPTSLPRRQTTL